MVNMRGPWALAEAAWGSSLWLPASTVGPILRLASRLASLARLLQKSSAADSRRPWLGCMAAAVSLPAEAQADGALELAVVAGAPGAGSRRFAETEKRR